MAEDPGDGVELLLQARCIQQRQVVHIQHRVAVIADEALAPLRLPAEPHQLPCHLAACHVQHLHRNREAPESGYALGWIDDAHKAVGSAGNYLLTHHGPAAALDELPVGIHLVSPVHIHRQPPGVVQLQHADATGLQLLLAGDGGSHDPIQPGRVQAGDEATHGAATAYTDDGQIPDVFQGGLGSGLFVLVLSVHGGSSG